MKIAFYVYPVAFQSPGGGEILLLKILEYLKKEGVDVRLFDTWTNKLQDFDILHTFGSVKDALRMMETAKFFGVQNVLSTICWHSWKAAWGTYPQWKRRSRALIQQAAKTLFPGWPSGRRKMFRAADLLIPNSDAEAGQLRRYFAMPSGKILPIPNGVDGKFRDASPVIFHQKYDLKDFVLCVGRIEPRKNQLNVIRALNGISRPVVFIGGVVPGYEAYYEKCRKEARTGMHFLGPMSHDSEILRSAYAACDTFLLATWLETPGLAALEAGLAGAKVVITEEGSTREYFSDLARYIKPDNLKLIRRQTEASISGGPDQRLKKHIEEHYLWPAIARKYIEAYQRVLRARKEIP